MPRAVCLIRRMKSNCNDGFASCCERCGFLLAHRVTSEERSVSLANHSFAFAGTGFLSPHKDVMLFPRNWFSSQLINSNVCGDEAKCDSILQQMMSVNVTTDFSEIDQFSPKRQTPKTMIAVKHAYSEHLSHDVIGVVSGDLSCQACTGRALCYRIPCMGHEKFLKASFKSFASHARRGKEALPQRPFLRTWSFFFEQMDGDL